MVLIADFTKMKVNSSDLPCFIGGKDLRLWVKLRPYLHRCGTPHHFHINQTLSGKKPRCNGAPFPLCHDIFCTSGNILWNRESALKDALSIGNKAARWQNIHTIKGKTFQDFATAKTFNFKVKGNLS